MENSQEAIIAKIETEIAPITEKAKEVSVVKNAGDENRAVEFLSQIKRRFKIVDDARTFLVKPLNDHVKSINARFKETLAPLESAEVSVKAGITAWRSSAEFKELEEKRIALEQEALLAAKQGDTPTVVQISEEHAIASKEAPKSVVAESGKAHFRELTKFEITDANIIPREFLMPDEKKIKAAIEAGAKIEGVKSWKESVPVIR